MLKSFSLLSVVECPHSDLSFSTTWSLLRLHFTHQLTSTGDSRGQQWKKLENNSSKLQWSCVEIHQHKQILSRPSIKVGSRNGLENILWPNTEPTKSGRTTNLWLPMLFQTSIDLKLSTPYLLHSVITTDCIQDPDTLTTENADKF